LNVVDFGLTHPGLKPTEWNCGFETRMGQTKEWNCGFENRMGQTKEWNWYLLLLFTLY